MQPIETVEFWQEEFEVSERDLEKLYERFVEDEVPRTTGELARQLIERRAKKAEQNRRARAEAAGPVYQPKEGYEVGQRLLFPALGEDIAGEIVDVREGRNPEYGLFKVIQVRLDGDRMREFASEFPEPHVLNIDDRPISIDDLSQQFDDIVREQLLEALSSSSEFVRYGDQWILTGLLPEIHVGYRNIAEAMIVVADDALPTERLLEEIELSEDIPLEARKLALNQALSEDERFINVGAISEPLWALGYQREESA
ncbi:MAG: hypothetical protein MAG451_01784 [Anaerolineales bacterium]|nr:hypothetical protein [Anaerolineales bacterium]